MPNISFDAPPTVGRFMRSDAFFRLIAGPVGSGKTTGCIFELLRRAIGQERAPDGLRYTRFAIVRQTLEQLRMTVLKDIQTWLDGICSYKVSDKTIHIEFGDVRSEWLLIPLEDEEDQRRLLSSQLTGAWMSECIEINAALIPALLGRVGRYPSAAQGGASWFGVVADTNMPTESTDWHKLMAVETPPDWEVFVQPGGLEPDAENLEWLTQTADTLKLPKDDPFRLATGRRYYERLARNPNPDWVKRYVHAQYGNDPSGSAVFRETFRRAFHVDADGIEPSPGYPLIIGQDFGRNPCAIIGQIDHRGRLLILDEVVSEDMGLELHCNQNLRPTLSQPRYLGMAYYLIGDPAGKAKNTAFEETSFDTLARLGFRGYPAPTNAIDMRLRAVDAFLQGQRDGGPAILIDGIRCPKLILALQGRYRYAKRKNGQLSPLPEKSNPWSDLVDALQYLALAAHGGLTEYVATRMTRPRETRQVRPMPVGAWT